MFFGYELGAQTSYTNKKGEGERAVINGHHDTPVFQKLVDDFIEKYVLCMGCNLPEIDMVVNKKGLIVATCKACGWNGELDNRHKLATYISKNPPSSGIGFDAEKKEKKSKEDRQRERAAKQKKKQEGEDDDANSYRSDEEKDQKEKKSKKEKKDKEDDDGDDEVKEKKDKKEKKSKKEKKDKKDKKDKKEKKEKKDKKDKKEK